jgi:hypothetical protein
MMYSQRRGAFALACTNAVFERQWQSGQEFGLGLIESRPRPIDGLRGNVVHATGAGADRSVMIAEQGHRAGLDLAHHRVHCERRVRAIADIVAEKNEATDAGTTGVLETRFERFAVGVNVAEKSDPHEVTGPRRGRNSATFL